MSSDKPIKRLHYMGNEFVSVYFELSFDTQFGHLIARMYRL